ncbi:hypothetical protein BS50DRAFT_362684 [Corynespora cassiicola Philippines]|uniref:Uncharacterized protein n=1 Tax=Corynespora cassiicola Philippines TaxID=1448308 RepID=A0A2T2NTI3_CORCC|nr:hypothetical protein BS50DRAFT_362684 [Corynespora cassiicola Philippines]
MSSAASWRGMCGSEMGDAPRWSVAGGVALKRTCSKHFRRARPPGCTSTLQPLGGTYSKGNYEGDAGVSMALEEDSQSACITAPTALKRRWPSKRSRLIQPLLAGTWRANAHAADVARPRSTDQRMSCHHDSIDTGTVKGGDIQYSPKIDSDRQP